MVGFRLLETRLADLRVSNCPITTYIRLNPYSSLSIRFITSPCMKSYFRTFVLSAWFDFLLKIHISARRCCYTPCRAIVIGCFRMWCYGDLPEAKRGLAIISLAVRSMVPSWALTRGLDCYCGYHSAQFPLSLGS